MKRFVKLFLLFIAPLLSFTYAPSVYFHISTSQIGPYETNQLAYIDVNVNTKLPTSFRLSLHIYLKNNDYGEFLFFASPFESYTITSKKYHIKLNTTYLIDSGLTISFKLIYSIDNRAYAKASCMIYPYQNKTYQINNLENGYYVCPQYIAKITNNETKYFKDEASFIFPQDYFDEYYYRLTLDRFLLEFNDNYPIFSQIKLIIDDKNKLFPFISSSRTIFIDLTLIKTHENIFQLTFNCKLYVNPISLEMSINRKDGFIETNYFYLPRNKKQEMDGYIINILFEEFGMNKNNLIYSTRYYSSKNLIGDCYDSSICVIGGVDNG